MTESAERQLERFMSAYTPEIAAEARDALVRLRAQVPGAVEMVYDNYNGCVIGFGSTERASAAVLSIAMFPDHVTLCFLWGVNIPDPDGLLQGGGNQVRHRRLNSAADIDAPAIKTLIAEAVRRSEPSFDVAQPGRMVVKSISAKQRPRRPR